MEKMFGGLIEFPTKEVLDAYVEHIDVNDSIKIIESALEFAHGNGVYSMEETHIIYRCLLKLKNQDNEKVNLSTNSTDGDTHN